MSGLLDNLVRRRRVSASSGLDQPQNGHPSADEVPQSADTEQPHTNGHDHDVVNGSAALHWPQVNGHAPAEAEPEPEPDEQPTAVFSAVEPATAETPEPDEPESAAPEVAEAPAEPDPEFRRRGRLRRRARYLRSLREVQLRDLGGFVVELRRFGRERPDLVQAKLSRALATDAELRALDAALGVQTPPRELRQAGIGGACAACGAIHGSLDRYCATCGLPLVGAPPLPQSGQDPASPMA